ncbi:zf-HC2 domain-containing protein [bacterium]|nr:zf-HC2 domain-containing protein [bacterium]MBU4561190.1 zf-HC2 domain-containing protein [bacterium]MCG2676609.1 zf-HC2 domain-containing protein [bacterium]MCG2677966.1 zf-HC2 domain-containing protein [bacterium]
MISCRKVKRWMIDYLEGTLSKKKKVLFKKHLSKCSRCAQEVEALVKTQRLVRLKAREEMPEGFWAHYLPRLKRRLEEKPLPRLEWRPVPTLALTTATALVLLIVVAVSLLRIPGLDLESLPREVLVEEVRASNSELDYFIADSFEPEEIVQALIPQEILDSLINSNQESTL